MSYTSVANVAGMFPTFLRGTPQQKPSDALIQQYIDDVAGDIDAVLQRRFAEVVGAFSTFAGFVASLSTDAVNVLEKINRYGAAAQLAETLASFGVAAAREMEKDFDAHYMELLRQLNAEARDGKPMTRGMYDHLFDSQARSETPRPALKGLSGGDQPVGQTPKDTGSSAVFGKFDKRGT